MPKKIAIDWDATELRMVVGKTSANGVTVTNTVIVPIAAEDEGGFAKTLKSTCADLGLSKLPVLVTIGRGKAELRPLTLPPVPDEELPDMVRYQAIRDFAAAGEKAIIDFVPVRSDSTGVEVVAAAMAPDQLNKIDKLFEVEHSAPERMALRPLAAAALFAKRQPSEGEVVLVDLLADDADIVILRGGKPVFVRSFRLPADPTGRPAALAGEVRRSVMASGSGDGNPAERRIVIWGRKEDHAEDIQQLSQRIGLQVETLDPFSLVAGEPTAHSHVGRLAPLVGLLDLDESGSPLLIDFRNPRERPAVESQRGRYLLYGTAAAAAVLIAGFGAWSSLNRRDATLRSLRTELTALEPLVKESEVAISRAEKVDSFLDGNVIWLQELKRVAETVPPAEEMLLTNIAMNSPAQKGGELTLSGRVTKPSVLDKLRRTLTDEQHRVIGQGAKEEPSAAVYGWVFDDTKIVIEPDIVRSMRDIRRYEASLNGGNQTPQEPAPAEESKPEAEAETETTEAEMPAAEPATEVAEPAKPAKPEAEPAEAEPAAEKPESSADTPAETKPIAPAETTSEADAAPAEATSESTTVPDNSEVVPDSATPAPAAESKANAADATSTPSPEAL